RAPAQLPFDTQGFTGRHDELDMLDATRLAVIHGGPGFGKTALAVRWAHQVAGRFPDGQLFLNLRGHHPTLGPTPPVEVLRRLLDSLGITWAPSTPDLDEGASLWRSSLAGKRVLIVLDDAVSADQVRPALPGAPGCALVVTSRRRLSELVVSDGADSIALGTLAEENSVAVLEQTISPARIAAEPQAARALAAACGHLPLALRMAGAVLSSTPAVSLTELADALTAGSQLTALETLASPSVVENAFELSYRGLPEDARLLFRRLALMPGPDLNADVAALLTDLPADGIAGTLRVLIDAHIIEPVGTGRYRMHDLLRDYAVRLCENTDTPAERDAAHQRLLDWYVDRALAISVLLGWSGWSRDLIWIDERSTNWRPSGNDAAAWLDAEKRNIVSVIEHDAKHGSGRYAWTLVDLLADSLLRRNDVSELIVATDASLVAARRHRERRAEARLLLSRGWLRWRNAITGDVTDDFASAVELFRSLDDPRGKISALRGLADCHIRAGRIEASKRCLAE
ncbi:MAG: transcriptional regulator, partial [Sciscionella sp.]|nr:transcriptional regulator [Sciscionella sp.]